MTRPKKRRNGSTGAKSRAELPSAYRMAEPAPALMKLNRYCELSGDTPDAVHTRRKRGEWIDGRHCHLIGGRRLWIDLAEVNAWVRSGGIQAN